MLLRIHTNFFFKIFGHIREQNILKIIKYNKKIQKLIDINPNYYKYYSKKFIIYESNLNDNGNEYNDRFELIYIEWIFRRRKIWHWGRI